jgi:hypothetical protein
MIGGLDHADHRLNIERIFPIHGKDLIQPHDMSPWRKTPERRQDSISLHHRRLIPDRHPQHYKAGPLDEVVIRKGHALQALGIIYIGRRQIRINVYRVARKFGQIDLTTE